MQLLGGDKGESSCVAKGCHCLLLVTVAKGESSVAKGNHGLNFLITV